jgi:protein-L-isoaspartate(D-aspartate) O-methyltransferase
MMSLARKRSLKLLLFALALPTLVLLLSRLWHDSGINGPVQTQTDVSDSKHNSPENDAARSQNSELALKPDRASDRDLGKPARPISADVDDPLENQAAQKRLTMVQEQLAGRDITDKRVLKAMRRVRRHLFVPEDLRDLAYTDRPLPIGHGQTISQPYIVALMTQLGHPGESARVLDVGTGSGYQAAVLAELVQQVYSIEILCPLADAARQRLKSLGYDNVEVRCGDGHLGWSKHAPFDVIIVAAAPEHVPQPLIDQLASGGRLVIPVGKYYQELIVIEKQPDGSIKKRTVAPVAFVPMTRDNKDGGKAR